MAKPIRLKTEELPKATKRFSVSFKPRPYEFTKKQKQLLALIESPDTKICFIVGPAGSSKTLIAAYAAIGLMGKDPDINIMYLRSVVESSSHSMGFLPGEKEDKMAPYLTPLEDKLHELLKPEDVGYLKANKFVEGGPINFLRGGNWISKVVIADESQNYTKNEFLTIMTRLAANSKLFILGDPDQSDIRDSGLNEVCAAFDDEESRKKGIHVFKFAEDDIVRSDTVRFVVKKFKDIR